MSNQKEEWRPVPGAPGYEVSDRGRVRSQDRLSSNGRRIKGRVLKPYLHGKGYAQIVLAINGGQKLKLVHRMVLEAFVGSAPSGHQACHGDNDRSNNALDNLRWDSCSGNNLDKRVHGTNFNLNKTHCSEGHRYSGANLHINVDGSRRCQECNRTWQRAYRARRAAKAAS